MWGDTLPKNRFLRFWVLLAHRYLKHNVATQSAALAFYLLFMIFPFLIFISALLGLLNLNVAGIVSVLADFLPEVVLELTNGLSPIVLNPTEGNRYSYMVLPVRLKAGE